MFRHACVVRCVEALARELLRRETIPGPGAEAFIAARISEEERAVMRRECCLARAETMPVESPSPVSHSEVHAPDSLFTGGNNG